ncbi:MAG: acyl-CoA/acyl-ACP dehydrogenase [Actinomycetia bacterium]|nr:acyl-CoA/acyl-ACP dehydrogenase [Actinomycetes bacterium]
MTDTNTPIADYGFGENEADLRDVAHRFLDDRFPTTRLRELVASDHEAVYDRGEMPAWDPDMWQRLVDMGWSGLAVPESAGGSGISLAGLVGLVEEVARHALPSPLISTFQASLLLAACDSGRAGPSLEAIANGSSATIAVTDRGGSWQLGDCDVSATESADGLVLSGQAGFVQDAAKADMFVVQCTTGEGHALVVVESGADGLRVEGDHIHDLTRDQATVHFDSVRVDGSAVVSNDGMAALAQAWPALLNLVTADLCGTSEWLLQTTVDYAKDRVQFDRPIGFFQAVKHPLVDVMVDIDRARSLLYGAAEAFDIGSSDAITKARMAKSAASDAGSYAADRSVQLHGGIGFTWEHDVHIYFKRTMHNQVLYGDGRYQRRQLAPTVMG